MNYEENRLQTFNNWPPGAEVEPFRIAKAGFFFSGHGVEVQCFRCGGKISEWNYGDQVMARHRRLDPQCPFVLNPSTSGNVPIVPPGDAVAREQNVSISNTQPLVSEPLPSGEDETDMNADAIYKNDALRILSFINWPVSYISRESLALAGFYYVGSAHGAAVDQVRCAWCGGELENWQVGDRPISEHLRYYPQCHYAMEKSESLNRNETSTTICNNDLLAQNNMSELGIQEHKVLIQQKYFTYESRLRSFDNRWPADIVQKPQALATAGFYYVGVQDQVHCFHCDGSLCKWLPTDDPWAEHAKCFPECEFLTLVKGKDFVDRHRSVNNRSWSGEELEVEVERCMGQSCAMAAMRCGLESGRVRRALRQRLLQTGVPYSSTDALIDATLNQQINETSFSTTPPQQGTSLLRDRTPSRYPSYEAAIDQVTRMIINSALSENEAHGSVTRPTVDDSESSNPSAVPNPDTEGSNLVTNVPQEESDPTRHTLNTNSGSEPDTPHTESDAEWQTSSQEGDGRRLSKSCSANSSNSLEEENRLLKEARMCKVCMDAEVGVVFLPCGHLVSCVICAACLPQCPLCRANVKGVVRTYLS